MTLTCIRNMVLLSLFFLGPYSKAQLSGVYTINSSSPTAAGNFSTFTDLATALNTSGVNGAVTVNVSGNLTYSEQVLFNQASGISATQSVLINGNGRTLTASGSSNTPWTLGLNGADYTTINDLHVIASGTYALACHLYNDASNNRFNNCSYSISVSTGFNQVRIPFSISGSANDGWALGISGSNNVVSTCSMICGYIGVAVTGSTSNPTAQNNSFLNCIIRDFHLYGVSLSAAPGSIVKGCIIERPTLTSMLDYYGIELSGANPGVLIEGNRFRNPAGAVPGSAINARCVILNGLQGASQGTEITVRNNLFSDLNVKGYIYAVYNVGAQYVNYYHNTVSLDEASSTATTPCYGIYINNATNTIAKNNIVTISRGGSGQKLGLCYVGIGTGTTISDGNCVHVAGGTSNAFFGYHSGFGNQSTHIAWKNATGMDLQGHNANPGYINPSLENYKPTSVLLNNIGLPLGVADDIVNVQRSLSTPDPGAYEYSFTCTSSSSPTLTINGATATCGSDSVMLTISGADIYSWSNGANTPTVMVNAGSYSVTGTNSLTGCTSTLSWNIGVLQIPNVLLSASQTTVCAGSIISLSGSGAQNYSLNNVPAQAITTVSPSGNTSYTLLGSNSSGCIGQATVQIIVNPLPLLNTQTSHTLICKGTTASLSATGASNYQWIFGSNTVTAASFTIKPLATTTFTLWGTDSQGCTGMSSVTIVFSDCLSVSDTPIHNNSLNVFPNPGGSEFTVISGDADLGRVTIFDSSGRILLQENCKEKMIKIDARKWTDGIYFIKTGVHILRIVKQY